MSRSQLARPLVLELITRIPPQHPLQLLARQPAAEPTLRVSLDPDGVRALMAEYGLD